jgi:4-hydroxy-tetrahydrodipicolinate synthase
MLPETVARCAENQYIVGIKEACGSLSQIADVIRLCPDDFILLSGDDPTAFPTMAIGGKGVISVCSNVMPKEMADMMNAYNNGDLETARELHYKMFPLFKALFFDPNPVPSKTALHIMGRIPSPEVRQPLVKMSDANLEKLRKVMSGLNLI